MQRLYEKQNLIEDKLADLLQLTHFCINNYDYHHRNNELEILREQLNMLKTADANLKCFLQRMHDFKAQLDTARLMCENVDQQFVNLGIKIGTSDSSFEEDIGEDTNKENELQEGDFEEQSVFYNCWFPKSSVSQWFHSWSITVLANILILLCMFMLIMCNLRYMFNRLGF